MPARCLGTRVGCCPGAKARAERAGKLAADRTADIERHRAEARSDLEARLKREFMASGLASEADWRRLGQDLIDAELAKILHDQLVAEMRRQPQYTAF